MNKLARRAALGAATLVATVGFVAVSAPGDAEADTGWTWRVPATSTTR